MASVNRPLSPHLEIYKHQVTSTFSILHRLTGVALMFGTVLLTYWFTAAAYGPEAFETAQSLMGSWFGLLVMFGFTFAFFFHTANGINHISWDLLFGFELHVLKRSAVLVAAFAFIMTVLTWYVGCTRAGVL